MLVDTASIWTAVVVGLLIFVLFLRTRLHYAAFPELKPGTDTRTDDLDVTVIIPARNEERLIAACIESLPKGVRVIVMNDNSKDATAKVSAAAIRRSSLRAGMMTVTSRSSVRVSAPGFSSGNAA